MVLELKDDSGMITAYSIEYFTIPTKLTNETICLALGIE